MITIKLIRQSSKCLYPKSDINNSFELKDNLKDIILDDDHFILSFDVSFLFTNISCNLVLDSLDRRFFYINENCKIPFDEIRECVTSLFDNTFFAFNNKIYQQICCTPLGSPISPLFTDIVMDYLENYCLSILKKGF